MAKQAVSGVRDADRPRPPVDDSVAFAAALALIGLWLISGPLFRFSNTWQLVIKTATTIVTFLMVF